MIDQHENLAEIEAHLQAVLEATGPLDSSDTIGVEQAAQRIHVCFGGTDLDAIYPEGTND